MRKRKKEVTSEDQFHSLIERNVEAIAKIERAAHARRTAADIVSDEIAGFCGRPIFVYVHIVFFAVWLMWNSLASVPKQFHFDPAPFNMLTLVVSLEAIFLSSFILISQNRQQRIADQRNNLDLQINLLAEQESSQMLVMMKKLMEFHGIEMEGSAALQEDTDPVDIAHRIENHPKN